MIKQTNNLIEIYVDGACSGNPGPAGWGAYLKYGTVTKEIFGYEIHSTNNRMEIQAAIEALKILKRKSRIVLYTDSIYLKNGMTKWLPGWIKHNFRKNTSNPVKNIDLWEELCELDKKHEIDWQWVKGHSDNPGNDKADYLACKGRDVAKEMLENEHDR